MLRLIVNHCSLVVPSGEPVAAEGGDKHKISSSSSFIYL